METPTYIARIAILLASFCVAGCQVFAPPTPPVTPLTMTQVKALESCQKTIKKAGLTFVKTKVVALESCVDQILKLQLERENQLIQAADFDAVRFKSLNEITVIAGGTVADVVAALAGNLCRSRSTRAAPPYFNLVAPT